MDKLKLIIFFFLSSFFCESQNVIHGVIKDSDDYPIPGASVKLQNTLKGTVSDLDGYFELKQVSFPAIIECSFLGYKKYTDTLFSSTSDLSFLVTLEKDIYVADELIVSATRADQNSPFTYTNIDKSTINTMNTGRDVPYIINQSPSAVSSSDAGAGIGYTSMRIRGVDQSNINVTINGISLNDAESHGVYWVDIPEISSSLSDIQIQRGVGTSTNGSGAFGATINMQTQKLNSEPYGEVISSVGSFNTYRGSVGFGSGLLKKSWTLDGRLSSIQSQGYVDRASSDLKSYYFSLGFNNGKTSVKALFFGGVEETYQAWYGVDEYTLNNDRTFNYAGSIYNNDGSISFYDNQIDHYSQDHIQLHLNQEISENLRFTIAGHITNGRGYFESYHQEDSLWYYGIPAISSGNITYQTSDIIDQEWLSNKYYGLTYNLHFKKGHSTMDFGGGINQYFGDHYGEVIWSNRISSNNFPMNYYKNNGLKDDLNIYFKFNQKIGRRLNALLDLQYRTVSYRVYGNNKWQSDLKFTDELKFINPKIGVNYNLNSKNDVYYSIAVSNREPNRNDYLNAELFEAKPEQLVDQELGYRKVFSGNWLEINAYYMYYFNQLVLTGELNNVGEPLRENSGRSFRSGIEISAGFDLMKNLKWSPNISLSQNRNVQYNFENTHGDFIQKNTPIAYTPELIINNSFAIQLLKPLYLTVYNYYVGKQFMDNSGSEAGILSAYFYNDVRLEFRNEFKHLKSLTTYVMVNNVLNEKYNSNGYLWDGLPYYFPQAGINFTVGLNLKF